MAIHRLYHVKKKFQIPYSRNYRFIKASKKGPKCILLWTRMQFWGNCKTCRDGYLLEIVYDYINTMSRAWSCEGIKKENKDGKRTLKELKPKYLPFHLAWTWEENEEVLVKKKKKIIFALIIHKHSLARTTFYLLSLFSSLTNHCSKRSIREERISKSIILICQYYTCWNCFEFKIE